MLPYRFVSEDKSLTYEISELSTVCATQVEQVTTNTYLRELENVAKLTGKDYAEVLKDVMSLLGHSVAELGSKLTEDAGEAMLDTSPSTGAPPVVTPPAPEQSKALPDRSAQSRPTLPPTPDLNPPEIQRYVVEHIVKNEDSAMLHFSAQRLRAFSGRLPRPQNENDYETWRSTVDLMLNDPSISDLQRSRRIFESLLPPAADLVKHLTLETPAAVYIHTLDSAYGTVQDGDELYAKFMDTFQNAGEKPSSYLQRLQAALTVAVKRGGVPPAEVDKRLLNQFCRGCWDNTLISELQLKQRKSTPPSFSDLLLLLRTEEDREAAKLLRMKQHLGPAKVKSQAQYAYSQPEEKSQTATLEQLTRQLADIQRQLTALTAAQSSSKSAAAKPTSSRHSVLGFADPKRPYILHTDASTTGLGAALYQEQDGHLRVIAYASRGLSSSEARYPAHKLEFLALKWSITEKFHDYLYGANFVVVTDNNPLTYILTSAKLDAASHRWLAALSTYTFTLQYRAGKQNCDADALSRRPHNSSFSDVSSDSDVIHQFTQEHSCDPGYSIAPEVVAAICHSCLVRTCSLSGSSDLHPFTLVESLSLSASCIPDCYIDESQHGLPVIPSFSLEELRTKQRSDPSIREVIHQLETGERVPPTARQELPELALLLRELNRLELRDDLLYRKRQEGEDVQFQLVLPEDLRPLVLTSLHNDMGHLGIERTLDLVRSRFFWPRMSADVETKIRTCNRCVRRKTQPERAAPLVNIVTTRPLELVCMDFLSLEPDQSNTKDILVLTDHFTKFAVALPTPNQKARTVARCLWENFIVCYGFPERLHTDQGPDFESKLIKELCEISGIEKTRTTPYHPRGNPVERFNRTLLSMLGTLESTQKKRWKEYVKPLVHAYNCTRNDVTGFTPYELMFGRSPRLPIDLAFGLPIRGQQSKSHSQYVENLRSRLEQSYQLASKNSAKSAARNKSRFDLRVTPSSLEVGDRVLVRNVRLRGKHKLEDKWEKEVYVVLSRAGDLPVYTVRPESAVHGPTRTLHRDLLLPCGFLPVDVDPTPEPSPVRRPVTRSQPQSDPSAELCDEECDLPYLSTHPPEHFKFEHIVPVVSVPVPTDAADPGPVLPYHLPDLDESSADVRVVPPPSPVKNIEEHLPAPEDLAGSPTQPEEEILPVMDVHGEEEESGGPAETSPIRQLHRPIWLKHPSLLTFQNLLSLVRLCVVLHASGSRPSAYVIPL
ncbi:hypothetical protein WMY93_028137 [Mugilogobius chulae]|uniref:Gypsy retrotransposon integrase-like protein 1 n=1 Tax=Mugilogobius chulae TaxID=88201 RepID=A0AAW0MMG5_9GOBI